MASEEPLNSVTGNSSQDNSIGVKKRLDRFD